MTLGWPDAKQLSGLLICALLMNSAAHAANPWSESGGQGRYSGPENPEKAASGNPWAARSRAGVEAPRYAPAERQNGNRTTMSSPEERQADPRAGSRNRRQPSYRRDFGAGPQYGGQPRPYAGPVRRPTYGAYGPAGSMPYMPPPAPGDGFGPLGTGGFRGPEEFWD